MAIECGYGAICAATIAPRQPPQRQPWPTHSGGSLERSIAGNEWHQQDDAPAPQKNGVWQRGQTALREPPPLRAMSVDGRLAPFVFAVNGAVTGAATGSAAGELLILLPRVVNGFDNQSLTKLGLPGVIPESRL
jgi:hypothetical protein